MALVYQEKKCLQVQGYHQGQAFPWDPEVHSHLVLPLGQVHLFHRTFLGCLENLACQLRCGQLVRVVRVVLLGQGLRHLLFLGVLGGLQVRARLAHLGDLAHLLPALLKINHSFKSLFYTSIVCSF